jgi:uncharacterized membrane protein YccC
MWSPRYRVWHITSDGSYTNHGFMLVSVLSTVGFIVAICSLWIASGWHDGAQAVFVTSIACCFFAGLDEPAPQIFRFFLATLVSVIVSGIFLFVVLPHVANFETLVLIFAVPFLFIGTLIAHPKFNQVAIIIALFTSTFISLSGSYDANFFVFVNSSVAALAGLIAAFVWTKVALPFDVEFFVKRLQRETWADVALSASRLPIADEQVFFSRVLDRLSQLLPRLATSGPHHHRSVETYRDLHIVSNSLDLRRYGEGINRIDPQLSIRVDGVLANVQKHYERCVKQRERQSVPSRLIEAIDATLASIWNSKAVESVTPSYSDQVRLYDLVRALVSLRLSLASNAPVPPMHDATAPSAR